MKRSSAVHLILLTSAVIALEGCGRNQCVDEHNVVVDDRYCRSASPGYRSYYGGYFGYVPIGRSVSGSGTVRGVFGSAGEGAAHGGGEGAGE